MTFLQPLLLWGLAAVSIPILIHFLNRLRYRSVKWAAMMFLIKASRSSTRHARLRQYLILLFRSLLILFLVVALARPIVGGWLGLRIAGDPDTIVILLDRSASMESVDPRRQISKRRRALELLSGVAGKAARSSRYVLIESVLREPRELVAPSALADLDLAAATDTSADLPAMFRAALDYMVRNRTGRTELWVASDLRRNDWNPDSATWRNLRAQLGALPQDVRVRILALSDPPRRNLSVSLGPPVRGHGEKGGYLDLPLRFSVQPRQPESFPVTVTLNETRSQVDVSLTAQSLAMNHRLALPAEADHDGGWGVVEIPADENPRDNSSYFVYGGAVDLKATVVSDDASAVRRLCLAAGLPSSAERATRRSCDAVAAIDAAVMPWEELSLIAWQASAPAAGVATSLTAFVSSGGCVLLLPPGRGGSAPFGLRWDDADSAENERPFRVPVWEEYDGPLARTANGENLPVADLACARRQLCAVSDDAGAATGEEDGVPGWFALARYQDGRPFLLRRRIGDGIVYVCTTLPSTAWSTLGEGPVIVPMVQRMLQEGAQRLQHVKRAVCGEWRPSPDDVWVPVAGGEAANARWRAGVYRSGATLLALNRPEGESLPDTLAPGDVRELMGDIPVQIIEDLTRRPAGRLQSEIWYWFICLALVCAIAEAFLLLQEQIKPTGATAS